jgi:hypothetical protein
MQAKVQDATSPVGVRRVFRSSLQAVALAWQSERGSQVSPASIALLLHTAEHSLSLSAVQTGFVPRGQQRSPLVQVVVGSPSQRTLHWSGVPVRRWRVQVTSGQVVGQVDGGSQVSPGSIWLLPQPSQS